MSLLNINPSKLRDKAYICKEHFVGNCFNARNKSILKDSAIPTNFPCATINDVLMYKYDMEWKIPHILSNKIQEIDDVFSKQVVIIDVSTFIEK